MKTQLKTLAFSSLFFTLFVFNGWGDATSKPVQKPQTVTETETVTVTPMNKVTPAEAQIMSSDAVSVLRHIAEARGYTKDGHYSIAINELNQAQSLLDVIRSHMPVVRIKDRLAIAQKHLQFNDIQKVSDDLVPIYSDLTYVEDLVPSEKAKAHLDKAKESLKTGNKQQAMNELHAADQSITYTEIDLPLAETQQNVKQALIALHENQPQKVEKALIEVENQLQVDFTTLIEEPTHPKNDVSAGKPNQPS